MADTFLIGAFLTFCCLLLLLYYRLRYGRAHQAWPVLWWTLGLLAATVVIKYAIRSLGHEYVPVRFPMYAVPAPRLDGLPFIVLVVVALCGIAFWYRGKDWWAPWFKLALLWLLFVVFAVGVAGLRGGAQNISPPFMRVDMEYIWGAHLIESTTQFLRDYVTLIPQLSLHGKEHPPGNALVIHLLQRVFEVDPLGLALMVTAIGGLVIFPVYYFWRQHVAERDLENVLPVFMLTPSIVMFSATSMDSVSPPVFWTALLACSVGWKRSSLLSLAGGIIAGAALLLNFLFLAFGMVLLFFFVRLWLAPDRPARAVLAARAALSLVGLIGFFTALYALTGYSIVANFLAAFAVHHGVVKSGASSSAVIYLVFGLINILAFLLYLGIVHTILFVRAGPRSITRAPNRWILLCGFLVIGVFILSGVFQGEIERIWLFLVPLFLPHMLHALKSQAFPHGAAIALLSFQIIVIETLFHTYW